MGNDKTETPKKQYAASGLWRSCRVRDFPRGSGRWKWSRLRQVKAVLDRINIVLKRNLSQGRRVNVGELGNFRFGVGSTGAATTEEFSNNLIKEPKVVFSPGKALRVSKKLAVFEKAKLPEAENPSGGDSESPDEI